MKYYTCTHCGQTVAVVKQTGAQLMCCLKRMKESDPFSKDDEGDGEEKKESTEASEKECEKRKKQKTAGKYESTSGNVKITENVNTTGNESVSIKRNMKNWCRDRTKYIS